MIDIHSHILYGLDDGASSVDESVAMLRLAAEGGTTDIVATPHANSRFPFDPDLVDERIRELAPSSPVRIHRGCDFRLQADTIEDALAHPAKYTINQKGYLLVEFPDLSLFANADAVLLRLLDAGMTPIVTHPERNAELRRRIDDLARWVEMGCHLQITAGAVTGGFGRRAKAFTSTLMDRGLVHFVASDAHDTRYRPPTLAAAYAVLSEGWGEDAVRPLFIDNPRAVLAGEAIDMAPQAAPPPRKRWWRWLDGRL